MKDLKELKKMKNWHKTLIAREMSSDYLNFRAKNEEHSNVDSNLDLRATKKI